MLKQYYGTALLLITLVVAWPDRALSQLSPDEDGNASPLPTQRFRPASRFDEPICYMKTASGQLINLGSICEDRPAKAALNTRSRSLGNIRVRSSQTVRSGAGYSEDSNSNSGNR
jgi:hypothetical protein